VSLTAFIVVSFKSVLQSDSCKLYYLDQVGLLKENQENLLSVIQQSNLNSSEDLDEIKVELNRARIALKNVDFWLRYLEPVSYKKINGPLPVEWETEVFEKFEAPYKREGAGLTLAAIYMNEERVEKDSLLELIQLGLQANTIFYEDSITAPLKEYHHFFLCNRLFLLNLSAIYTTGFECPDTDLVIPELISMVKAVNEIYTVYNKSFPDQQLSTEYLKLYGDMLKYLESQPIDFNHFDRFTFIRDFVNPLFALNQDMIRGYHVVSKSAVDYSLNKSTISIFDKSLYDAQNAKGVFLRVKDEAALVEIRRVGKLLFYDPLLSGNNSRSCASCHRPTEYFTDTAFSTSLQFNRNDLLPRNTPSLINANYNHLLMLDGKHISLQDQVAGVITNPIEMGGSKEEILKKILSCADYQKTFKSLLKYTPHLKEVSMEHISAAITIYYSEFSVYDAPFDRTMNKKENPDTAVVKGFNLFMSKAQCGTCHFVPQFNGVKPPYTNSEFEVLGVPEQKSFVSLSDDKGRFVVYPSKESRSAFRTGSLRNIEHTGPYMHNGVFFTLEEVIKFYNEGGGAGRGLSVDNQTLSSDSLHLTKAEENYLLIFMKSLNESIVFEAPPLNLPLSKDKLLNNRKVGGEY
jgi:cytochrome c peroxidase